MTVFDELLRAGTGSLADLIAGARPWVERYGVPGVAVSLFTETFLFTGTVAPGYGVLLAAGFLVGAGVLDGWATLTAAALGAVLGDQASYWLGASVGERLLRRKGAFAARLRRSLEEESVWLLLAYHHVPPVRAVLPAVAGTARFSYRRWLALDTLGVVIWVIAVMLLGYSLQRTLSHRGEIVAAALSGTSSVVVLIITVRIYRRVRRTTLGTAPPEAGAQGHQAQS